MIEIKERLNVSAKDFFSKIEESVIYDIEQSMGKKMVVSDIRNGFKYTKNLKNKLGGRGEVEVVITHFASPKMYSANFKSASGVNTICYIIDEIDDENIDVIYKEEFVGKTGTANLNFKIMNFFYKKRSRKRASKRIRYIESYIKSNKE
ncbi:DUF3284 domain-containing protein [Candidatus Arthromitus sp. SFB-rat-Yit]|uniref:DUF3284 domain-containing protein n=1 Tax=Candidatus Arthromitus sp. SFB-rat-Yit TaxID=1041504 RepID=UPI000227A21A|nr:DUF3284 domain-containing protein [Candidatus Arthromitus sp. SFB-rat-Yit]BAK81410.1 hypothetical protein RATSFB_0848 [Candidatus Arthromitus sp. SFB-rat-Yit]